MVDFGEATRRVRDGSNLSSRDVAALVGSLLDGAVATGSVESDDVRQFLIALHDKGEVADELVGAATAMREHMTPIGRPPSCDVLLDTCGTGGSGSGTFNISTAAAIVVSAAGVAVAKHGNRRATSRTGSADVLAALGVRVESDRAVVERSLCTLNLCFCFAPMLHPAMRHVAEIRRGLGVPTMFNLLGPLCNPAGATHQLLGTGARNMQPILAEALSILGTERSIVVCGADGQDEVTLDGVTTVLEIRRDGPMRTHHWTAETFGLAPSGVDAMQASDPEESAAIIRDILDGAAGPCRDIVVANSAAALWLVGRCEMPRDGARLAAETIDSGAARRQLSRFVDATRVDSRHGDGGHGDADGGQSDR